MNGFGNSFLRLPPVIKNLILINALMFLAYWVGYKFLDINLNSILGIYFPRSDNFKPVQVLSHMFMHANFWHLFFNMYALFIFGIVLENVWGSKRFLIYYFVCGFGAVLLHEAVIGIEYHKLASVLTPEQLQTVISQGTSILQEGKVYENETLKSLQYLLSTPTVGASGAIFGVLLAFGVLFPNTQLMLLFPPIPIKAKYFVLIYGAIELFLAFYQEGSNIAHVAHLGGMLFGYFLIRYWRKTTKTLY